MSGGPFDNLDRKTFKQAVIELLETEYKLVGSHKIIELMAEDITQLQYKYYPRKQELSFGKLRWVTTSRENGKPSLGQKLEEYKQKIVDLPYITEEDIELKRNNVSKVEHDLIRIERLTKAAHDQGALLTVEELAAILNRSTSTISRRIQEYHKENDDVLPLKGYVFDMGRGITHKKQILRLYEEGTAPPDIARQTNHSLEAVDRYIKDYERVKFLARRDISKKEMTHLTGRGRSVITQYLKIIKQYHPEYFKDDEDD